MYKILKNFFLKINNFNLNKKFQVPVIHPLIKYYANMKRKRDIYQKRKE